MNRRGVLTELGPDAQALRAEDRDAILFDLGLGALQADFCVRIDDGELAASLRQHAGRPIFEPGNPAMGIILQANPHRVFSPARPHRGVPADTAAIGQKPGRTAYPCAAKAPEERPHPSGDRTCPAGWIPCAHLYPAHAARDGLGQPRAFEAAHLDAFQQMLAAFGDPEIVAIKQRVRDAVRAGQPPAERPAIAMAAPHRVALRQMKAAGDVSPALSAWLQNLDQGSLDQT